MAMEINACNNYSAQTNSTSTIKSAGSEKDSNVTTSTVELKTSTPGVTRTEQIKTGYSNVNDYSRYLRSKYSYMNKGTVSMQGVPVSVSVSGAFLEKCMNDPEKAKYLEENLAAIPDCVKSLKNYTKMMPGSPVVTYDAYIIDENGNITGISSCTNDPDGKIARENAARKAREKKVQEEKAAKRRKKKRAEEQRAAERRAEKRKTGKAGRKTGDFTASAVGTDVKTVTQKVITSLSGLPATVRAGFDIKA